MLFKYVYICLFGLDTNDINLNIHNTNSVNDIVLIRGGREVQSALDDSELVQQEDVELCARVQAIDLRPNARKRRVKSLRASQSLSETFPCKGILS